MEDVLKSLKIPFQTRDIATNETFKTTMRTKSGQNMAPQLFRDDDYLGVCPRPAMAGRWAQGARVHGGMSALQREVGRTWPATWHARSGAESSRPREWVAKRLRCTQTVGLGTPA